MGMEPKRRSSVAADSGVVFQPGRKGFGFRLLPELKYHPLPRLPGWRFEILSFYLFNGKFLRLRTVTARNGEYLISQWNRFHILVEHLDAEPPVLHANFSQNGAVFIEREDAPAFWADLNISVPVGGNGDGQGAQENN